MATCRSLIAFLTPNGLRMLSLNNCYHDTYTLSVIGAIAYCLSYCHYLTTTFLHSVVVVSSFKCPWFFRHSGCFEQLRDLHFVASVVGGVLTLCGAIGATFWTKRLERVSDKTNLASAFIGELMALKTVVERRQYVTNLKQCIKWVEDNKQCYPFYFTVKEDFFAVYLQNTAKIGLLPAPIPEKISIIYGLIFSIIEDVNDLRPNYDHWATKNDYQFLLFRYQGMIDLGETLLTNIDHLIPELRRISDEVDFFD